MLFHLLIYLIYIESKYKECDTKLRSVATKLYSQPTTGTTPKVEEVD